MEKVFTFMQEVYEPEVSESSLVGFRFIGFLWYARMEEIAWIPR